MHCDCGTIFGEYVCLGSTCFSEGGGLARRDLATKHTYLAFLDF